MKRGLLLQLILFLALGTLSTACQQSGGPIEGFDEAGSRETPPDEGSGDSSQFLITEFNGFSSSDFDGRIKTYYENGGAYNPDLVRIRFTRKPTGFDDGRFFRIYRGFVTESGAKDFDYDNPLTMVVEKPNFGNISGSMDFFGKSSLQDLNPPISTDQIPSLNLIVSGTTLAFEVLRITYHTSDGTVVSWLDVLIPAIRANPNEYAEQHPELKTLHPFWSLKDAGYSSQEYAARAEAFRF